MLFGLSLIALFLGPLAYRWMRHAQRWMAWLDGFLLVSVAGLVLLHLLPHSFQMSGWWAGLFALVGLFLPMWMERRASSEQNEQTPEKGTRGWIAAMALFGLLLHAALDGVALAMPHHHDGHHHGGMLAIAVVLHRLPVGLVLAHLLMPTRGMRGVWSVVVLNALATAVGYFMGKPLLNYLPLHAVGMFQALMTGTLLHILFERSPLQESKVAKSPSYGVLARWSGVGALMGIGALWILNAEHTIALPAVKGMSVGQAFWALSLESAPALLLAYVGAGLLVAFLRPAAISWMGRGSSLSQAFRGMIFGLPLPICSCGVVPLYQGLVRAGAPATAGMAFLIATPEIGLEAFLLSFPLLGAKMTWVRLLAAMIAALVVSVFVGRLFAASQTPLPAHAPQKEAISTLPWQERLRRGMAFGLGENAEHTLPWIFLGLIIAALLQPLLPAQALTSLPLAAQVPLAALIGLPVYVCASGSTPFVAILIAKGLSPGAAIAFLLTGPATNITTFGVLQSLHSHKIALAFGSSMVAVSSLLGWSVDLFLPAQSFAMPTLSVDHSATTLQSISLFLLALLSVVTLLRSGPRMLLGQLFPRYAPSEHSHDHSHDDHDHHGHDHHDHSHHDHDHGHHDHDHSHGHHESQTHHSESQGAVVGGCGGEGKKGEGAEGCACEEKAKRVLGH